MIGDGRFDNTTSGRAGGILPPASPSSSFTEHLRQFAPELLPTARVFGDRSAGAVGDHPVVEPSDVAPHGTTIVALTYGDGVLLAGDRRSTQGNLIATRDIRKVFITDDYSAAGIAGTAGIAIEMVRLFTVELEHYEKIEGVPLTFKGKANKLASMVRSNLGAALQGMVALPLFVGYDLDAAGPATAGRIVSFDPVGAISVENAGYHAIGSGSLFARSSLKKTYSVGLDEERAVQIAVEALYDAADDDTATGGPDLTRGIYPLVIAIDSEGAREIDNDRIGRIAADLIAERTRVASGVENGAQRA